MRTSKPAFPLSFGRESFLLAGSAAFGFGLGFGLLDSLPASFAVAVAMRDFLGHVLAKTEAAEKIESRPPGFRDGTARFGNGKRNRSSSSSDEGCDVFYDVPSSSD